MGGSSSKTSTSITNTTVNKNYLDTLNQTILNSAVNTLVNNANNNSSAVTQSNDCQYNVGNISGSKITVGGTQSNQATVNFNAVNVNTATADMSVTMMNSMIQEMTALNGTSSAANLNSKADAKNTTGSFSYGGGTSSKSATNVTNNVTNETQVVIKNLFQQNLENNFTQNTVTDCIGKTNQSNTRGGTIGSITGSEVDISCQQSNSLEQVQNCKALNTSISETTQKTFQELGFSTDVTNSTSNDSKVENTSTSVNTQTGFIQDTYSGIAGVFGSVGNLITGLVGGSSLAFLGPTSGSICLCVCCVVCILLVCTVLSSMGGKGDSGASGASDVSGISGFSDISGTSGVKGTSGTNGANSNSLSSNNLSSLASSKSLSGLTSGKSLSSMTSLFTKKK